MRTDQERYFIWKVIFPLQETIKLLSKNDDKVYYFDDKYSPPKEKIDNLCIQALHIFEQPEFSEYGISKRNELNIKKTPYGRIFSRGITAKHGSVMDSKKKYYSDSILKLPITTYYYEKEQMYNYGYIPILEIDDSEYSFFDDYFIFVCKLINLFKLKINLHIDYDIKVAKYNIKGNGIIIKCNDTYNFLNGMTKSSNIRILKKENGEWVPTVYNDIHFAIF